MKWIAAIVALTGIAVLVGAFNVAMAPPGFIVAVAKALGVAAMVLFAFGLLLLAWLIAANGVKGG